MTKTLFITGATSGFGAASARKFVREGWKVIGTGRRAERLDELATELGAELFLPIMGDVRDEAAMALAIAELPVGFNEIDVLINNAGLALGTAPAQKADVEQWRTMIDTNVMALVSLTHQVLPALIARKGLVINLSSTAATYPYPGGNVYGATKAFVRQFSLGLRSDLHGTGVRVTSIEPGMAETEFTVIRNGGNEAASDAFYKGVHPITPENVADTMFWIAQLPPHMNINRLEMMPVNQSWAPFQIHRDED